MREAVDNAWIAVKTQDLRSLYVGLKEHNPDDGHQKKLSKTPPEELSLDLLSVCGWPETMTTEARACLSQLAELKCAELSQLELELQEVVKFAWERSRSSYAEQLATAAREATFAEQLAAARSMQSLLEHGCEPSLESAVQSFRNILDIKIHHTEKMKWWSTPIDQQDWVDCVQVAWAIARVMKFAEATDHAQRVDSALVTSMDLCHEALSARIEELKSGGTSTQTDQEMIELGEASKFFLEEPFSLVDTTQYRVDISQLQQQLGNLRTRTKLLESVTALQQALSTEPVLQGIRDCAVRLAEAKTSSLSSLQSIPALGDLLGTIRDLRRDFALSKHPDNQQVESRLKVSQA